MGKSRGSSIESEGLVGAPTIGGEGFGDATADTGLGPQCSGLDQDDATDGIWSVADAGCPFDDGDTAGASRVDFRRVVGPPFLCFVSYPIVDDEESSLCQSTNDGLTGIRIAPRQSDAGHHRNRFGQVLGGGPFKFFFTDVDGVKVQDFPPYTIDGGTAYGLLNPEWFPSTDPYFWMPLPNPPDLIFDRGAVGLGTFEPTRILAFEQDQFYYLSTDTVWLLQ